MRLRLRLLIYFLRALFRPRLTPADSSSIALRVLPNDVDITHVTNDRYLSYMDLGRNDFAIRLGLLTATRRMGAYPSVRFCCLRFRRAAGLLEAIELRTRLLCWDDEAAWFEQEFLSGGRSIALGYCCAEIRAGGRNVPTSVLLEMAGHGRFPSPHTPEVVVSLRAHADAMRRAQQRHEPQPPYAA